MATGDREANGDRTAEALKTQNPKLKARKSQLELPSVPCRRRPELDDLVLARPVPDRDVRNVEPSEPIGRDPAGPVVMRLELTAGVDRAERVHLVDHGLPV